MKDNGARQNGMVGLREKRSMVWYWDKEAVMSYEEQDRAGTSYEAPREVGGALGESEVLFSHASGGAGTTSWTGLMGIPGQLLQWDEREMPASEGPVGVGRHHRPSVELQNGTPLGTPS